MHVGKNMGIMTTLKETYCRKQGAPPRVLETISIAFRLRANNAIRSAQGRA